MISPSEISAIVVTRGTRDLAPVLQSLMAQGYDEVIVWDNSRREDAGIFGRYVAAVIEARNDVVYFQDDDLILHDHQALWDAYEPDGRLYANMIEPGWWQHCGYHDFCLVGAGSLVDRAMISQSLGRYFAAYPEDDFFRRHCDFIFGVLTPFKRLELDTTVLEAASDDEALWRDPEQMAGKWEAVRRARALRKVVLTMLAKNERENIVRAIGSAKLWVDFVLVHDTGSTDGTPQTVRALCDGWGIPCLVREHCEFVNFGYNRSILMGDAKQFGDYQLLMDADEELIDVPVRPELSKDEYLFHYEGPYDYSQPRLLRSGCEWVWMDDVHSYLSTHEAHITTENLLSPQIRHHGGERGGTRERLIRDLQKMSEQVRDGSADSRTVFNMAKALEGLGEFDHAKDLFHARTLMGDWDEEVFFARWRLGALTARVDFDEGAKQLLRAWRERPWRIEPLRELARLCHAVADQAPYPKDDMVFVRREDYISR